MVKKPRRAISVYANLAHKRRTKKDAAARKKAEYLATLPKHPLKRLLYRMHPRRVIKYWFSKKGAFMLLKLSGAFLILIALVIGGLFAYYRKDLDSIQPGKLADRVQTTVTRYYDRRGPAGGTDALLWEDKGDGDYKLVVKSDEINDYMKHATVAIEDQDFYKHHGVSLTGLARAFLNNASGGSTQGGSTLTQQLVKQVFFADEAQQRGINGIPRKIKELILSIEVERMYDKDQILTLYLNESPYGGRRNGVESAAQTYFGKDVHAKNLTLAQASLLAAIPNQPGLYDPHNVAGNPALIERQHKVLDNMVNNGYVTRQQADDAKKVPILDTIIPDTQQYEGMKAQHFVLSVKKQLEDELGKAVVGRGGLTVTTSLDQGIQNALEQAMREEFASYRPKANGYSNAAGTVEDVKTGQVLAELGSRDFNYPGYGQDNAAEAFIQPGSSVKPLVYSELFKDHGAGQLSFGSGSVLKDENIDSLYGAKLQNADHSFKGNLTIRQSLAQSRNVPAVKAMAISGVQPTLKTIRDMGDTQYCTQGNEVGTGLASAIGGCGTRQIDHVNAFASLARGGVYKPHEQVLEVRNSQDKVIKKWKDTSKQILDPQIPYILSDILNDANARKALFGNITTGFSYGNTGIRTATKTGTSDLNGQPRDLWVMTYSPAIAMGVWLGNSDTKPLLGGNSSLPGYIVDKVMRYAHLEDYAKQGKWKPGDWFTQPAGIQVIDQNGVKELYPSWYKKPAQSNQKQTFDTVSKKKATQCTPDAAKTDIDVVKSIDPVTKKDVLIAPNGYDGSKDDDVHKCDDVKPSVSNIAVAKLTGNNYRFTVSVVGGTHPLQQLTIKLNDTVISTTPVSGNGDYTATYTVTDPTPQTVTATITDNALYSTDGSSQFTPL